jgi:hypothetical protein
MIAPSSSFLFPFTKLFFPLLLLFLLFVSCRTKKALNEENGRKEKTGVCETQNKKKEEGKE